MPALDIIIGLIKVIPVGAQFVADFRATLAENDQATLDAILAQRIEQVGIDHAALDAALKR